MTNPAIRSPPGHRARPLEEVREVIACVDLGVRAQEIDHSGARVGVALVQVDGAALLPQAVDSRANTDDLRAKTVLIGLECITIPSPSRWRRGSCTKPN